MRAGLMTETITVSKSVQTKGDYGDTIDTWSVVASDVPCRVVEGVHTLLNDKGEMIYSYSDEFHIRYDSKIKEYMQIAWDDRKYRIKGIKRDRVHGEMTLLGELINE